MLAAHDDISPAVGLARDNRDLGHGGLGIGEDQLGAVADDPAVFLVDAGHESGDIHQSHDGDVEAIAEPDEAGRLGRGVDVQDSGQILRLVAHQTHRASVHPGKPHHHVGGEVLVDLQELFIVDDLVDDLPHVVGPVGVVGQQVAQVGLPAVRRVVGGFQGAVLQVVAGQKTQKVAHLVDAFLFSLVDKVGHAAAGGMGCRAAQFLVGHLFTGDRLDHLGAGDVHLAGALDHEHEIGDGRGVYRAAGRRPNDHRYLGNDARVHGVAQKDVAVGGQAIDAFLDAGAARVVQPDHGATGLHRQVQHLADLLADGL